MLTRVMLISVLAISLFGCSDKDNDTGDDTGDATVEDTGGE
jgi:hypothetical protein